MDAAKALFDSPSFHHRVSDAYVQLIKFECITGMLMMVEYLESTGWNVHSVANQLTITNKLSRNPMCARVILDMAGGEHWRPLRNVAKSVHQAQWYIAYYFDEEHMSYLKREMDDDDTILDQGSEEATSGRLA